MANYTLDDLCQMIDHTNLHADATAKDMINLCKEAKKYHFKMVAVNQVQAKICAENLQKTDIDTGAAISFPLGQTTIESKVFDTKNAIKNGANEIDYVINISELKNRNYSYIRQEMTEIAQVCHAKSIPCKVIFENAYLKKEEIKKLSKIAQEVKVDFIKTSTGFGPSGATVEDVLLMKKTVGNTVKVKAAGGISNADDFLAMIEAGADRIGTSHSIKIIEELKKRMLKQGATSIVVDYKSSI